MSDEKAPREGSSIPGSQPEPPALSGEFYARLLRLPSCKSRGYCDNCGRCEH